VPRTVLSVSLVDPDYEASNRLKPRPVGSVERLTGVIADYWHRSPNSSCGAGAVAPCGFEVSVKIEDVGESDNAVAAVRYCTCAEPFLVRPGENFDPLIGEQFAAEKWARGWWLAPDGFPSLQLVCGHDRRPTLREGQTADMFLAQPLGAEQDLEAVCGEIKVGEAVFDRTARSRVDSRDDGLRGAAGDQRDGIRIQGWRPLRAAPGDPVEAAEDPVTSTEEMAPLGVVQRCLLNPNDFVHQHAIVRMGHSTVGEILRTLGPTASATLGQQAICSYDKKPCTSARKNT